MPTNKELESKVEELTELVKKLILALPQKEVEEIKQTEKVEFDTDSEEKRWIEQELGGPSDPVLVEMRGIVDNLLNKFFGIHVKSQANGFIFTILVPKKYSLMSEEQWKLCHFDKRPKLISNAEGVEGIKIWADKVFSSFSPEYQSMIVSDRITNI